MKAPQFTVRHCQPRAFVIATPTGRNMTAGRPATVPALPTVRFFYHTEEVQDDDGVFVLHRLSEWSTGYCAFCDLSPEALHEDVERIVRRHGADEIIRIIQTKPAL